MSIPSPTAVHDVKKIDLDRHGLIEASAGTGKTYTIENLVVRLLMEKPALFLENILLVTFTEKATSELKIRIREKIEAVLTLPGLTREITAKMTAALESFDTASIQTIHGFCHSLLRDYSFENDHLFQSELVDDRPIFDKLLKELMRTTWPNQYGRLLPELLSISGFTRDATRYLETIIAIAAGGFNPKAGDRLYPDPDTSNTESLIKAFGAAKTKLLLLICPDAEIDAGANTGINAEINQGPRFSDKYNRLNFHAGSRKAIIRHILIPLEEWAQKSDPEPPDLIGFAERVATMQAYAKFKKSGPEVIKPQKYNRGDDNSREVCPHLDDVISALTDLIRLFDSLKHILAAESIGRLKNNVATHKRMNGTISYNDMLTQVHAALTSPRAGRLLDLLRKRYHYAFVDEFQDTDPIQWQIFERIFIESESSRLFLIGDPKQAIYSFRGADVFTYLTARYKMEQLADQNRARLYFLEVNYRSEPDLVKEFNRLFATTSWFDTSGDSRWHKISYTSASSPEPSKLPEVLIQDESGRNAFNIVDLRGPETPSQAGADLARFIAAEINHLATNSRMKIRRKDGSTRPLDIGDIAILVRSRPNAVLLESELADWQIPCSYYRKPGLFASDEAYYLGLILRAILDPSDAAGVKKALLTPFFGFRPNDLYVYEDQAATHPVRQLFLLWHGLANERRWGELFQSIMTDTGLIFREAKRSGWDRMEANYNQIIAYLNDVAYRKNGDFEKICAQLEGLRRQTISADEKGDIHEIETEARKVQILTMHQAKGLQFPVVFIGGGLTQQSWEKYHQFHQIDNGLSPCTQKVIDLTCTSDPDRYRQELTEEDKRLFYVALTRAQFKLYAPFFPAPTKRSYFGPVCRFMARAIEDAFLSQGEESCVTWLRSDAREHKKKNHRKTDRNAAPGKSPPFPLPTDLVPPEISFSHRTTRVESFSSIHAKKVMDADTRPIRTTFSNGPAIRREDDEVVGLSLPPDPPSLRPVDDIPGGPEVGSMFHDILENIDFSVAVDPAGTLDKGTPAGDLIDQQMVLYSVESKYRDPIVQVIIDTLTKPIAQIEKNFILGKLKPVDRLHEVDFYYTVSASPGRLVRGVIDLVFRYQEKYYIADWKSNRLEAGYGNRALADSMDTSDYRLQYRLYTIAVLRWLSHLMGDNFNPKDQFGGVFYFYLRGMKSQGNQGIYYVPPHKIGTLASLEAETEINFGPGL